MVVVAVVCMVGSSHQRLARALQFLRKVAAAPRVDSCRRDERLERCRRGRRGNSGLRSRRCPGEAWPWRHRTGAGARVPRPRARRIPAGVGRGRSPTARTGRHPPGYRWDRGEVAGAVRRSLVGRNSRGVRSRQFADPSGGARRVLREPPGCLQRPEPRRRGRGRRFRPWRWRRARELRACNRRCATA